MKSMANHKLKKQSPSSKNKKKKVTKNECPCPCIHYILTKLIKKQPSISISNKSAAEPSEATDVDISDESTTLKSQKFAAINTTRIEATRTPIKVKRSRVIRIPQVGCTIPFVMKFFNNLSKEGTVPMETNEVSRMVNIISKVKKDLDEGKTWNGNVQLTKDLYLKLYKSGLVLHHKQ